MPLSVYPEDLTASLVGNYVVGETKVFATIEDRIFVPMGAPFYLKDLEVRDSTTNQLLSPGVDYYAMQPDKDAMMASVKAVMTVIWVTRPATAEVTIRYRAVGGTYQNLAGALIEFLDNTPVGSLGAPTWGTILDKPATFPPSSHNHLPNDWRGYTEVILLLEQIRVTLVSGDRPTLAAVYQHIEENISLSVNNYLDQTDLQQPVVHNAGSSGLSGAGITGNPLSVNLALLDDTFLTIDQANAGFLTRQAYEVLVQTNAQEHTNLANLIAAEAQARATADQQYLTIENANDDFLTRQAYEVLVQTNAQQHQQLGQQITDLSQTALTVEQGNARYVGQSTYNGHVTQNSLEHGNLLALINSLTGRFQALVEFEYAIGNFYWTSRRGYPNDWLEVIFGYKTFWRPIIDRMLFAVDPVTGTPNQLLGRSSMLIENEHMPIHSHVFPGDDNLARDVYADPAGGTFGIDGAELASGMTFPYDAASQSSPAGGRLLRTRTAGGGMSINILNPVVTAFCWQRYDPNEARPLRTISISNGALESVNLLDRFIARFGQPTIGERVRFIVGNGVLITATSTDTYAMYTGDWPPDTELELVIEPTGIVSGRGGNGGDGLPHDSNGSHDSLTRKGKNGGPGIRATHPLRVINNGTLAGGAGGGGASATWALVANSVYHFIVTRGGGGGVPFGQGGVDGTITPGANTVELVSWEGEPPIPSRNATQTLFGIGGLGVAARSGNTPASIVHKGGNGGGIGMPGEPGDISSGAEGNNVYTAQLHRLAGVAGSIGVAGVGDITVIGNAPLGAISTNGS